MRSEPLLIDTAIKNNKPKFVNVFQPLNDKI